MFLLETDVAKLFALFMSLLEPDFLPRCHPPSRSDKSKNSVNVFTTVALPLQNADACPKVVGRELVHAFGGALV